MPVVMLDISQCKGCLYFNAIDYTCKRGEHYRYNECESVIKIKNGWGEEWHLL